MEATTPMPTNLNPEELAAAIESVIFVAEEPMTLKALALLFAEAGVAKADVISAVNMIRERYESDSARGIELRDVAGGFQFRTKPTLAPWIQKLNIPKPTKLSQPSLETLAIIAYRQPIVRSEIEEIRGVDSGQVLKTLLERDLIKIIGKRDDPGSPLIYATTETFLSIFNLSNLEDLPSLRDVQDLERPTGTAADAAQSQIPTIAEEFPLPQIDETAIAARESVDTEVLGELEDQIRDLRKLERVIFPREETTMIAVPSEVQDAQENSLAEADSLPLSTDVSGADATPEDIGSSN
jgi:segregation and condensation protein B